MLILRIGAGAVQQRGHPEQVLGATQGRDARRLRHQSRAGTCSVVRTLRNSHATARTVARSVPRTSGTRLPGRTRYTEVADDQGDGRSDGG
ncbi:hypothetical protein, partial [Halopolyspora algeriensis]|uniref:hypothetical protein n=1 Tax=Halopolyspora algeriensis TaxID=1500506 RepID=UPI001C553123